MRQFQTMSRGTEARDFNLLQDNASYVQNWSAAQCFIVVLCTVVQVEILLSSSNLLIIDRYLFFYY
jgi:emp24/gp25L/p24 family/GOLD